LSIFKKIILLVLLVFVDFFVIKGIVLHKIEWSSLFPQQRAESALQSKLLQRKVQYIFCHSDANETLSQIKNSSLIEKYIDLNEVNNTALLLFDVKNKEEVLKKLQTLEKSGASLLEGMFFEDFYQEIYIYSITLLPFTLLFLLLFIPLRLWLDILLEMALYTLFLASFLHFSLIEVNSASLLALLFLVVYSLTLINYLYSENMDIKRLFFGIQVSIIATMISALFLIKSQFGLIHSFGVMLFVGLIVLYIYMNVRLYFVKYLTHEAHLYYFDVTNVASFVQKYRGTFLLFITMLVMMTILQYQNFTIDLNIVNRLDSSSTIVHQIKEFDKKYTPSLLFVIEIKAKKSTFEDERTVEKLLQLQEDLQKDFSGKILFSIPTAFREFQKMAIDKNNPDLLAQFLLANSFVHHDIELFSPDMRSTIFVAAVPLTDSSKEIITMKEKIVGVGNKYEDFSITLKGKIADFDNFLQIFYKESLMGLLTTLAFTTLFFLFYCKNILSVFVVLLSVVFSFSYLLMLHILFDSPLSITTLMSLILYAGLVADSFIQLFICYKSRDISCEKSVLNPIFVSNISILVFLFGMIFMGGILGAFAFDMFALLSANLIFIVILVPLIYKSYLKVYSD